MKAFFKNFVSKSKKPKYPSPIAANVSNPGIGPPSTAHPMPFVPTGSATASAQVVQAAGVTVSVQFGPPHRSTIILA